MDPEENTEPVVYQVNEGTKEESIIEEHAGQEIKLIQADETIQQTNLEGQNPTTNIEASSLLLAELDSPQIQPSEHPVEENKDAGEK